ncbi:unnamed protein product [Spodoptera littoralis]|uniref:ZAD domain-containing protein n=1 Tax=Spodoptera littoralis TaxID=7109 RepID=A0A9P0IEY8_SPOLI|nr:unnamed protein product [Spodoptera littoralis]CAH1645628.1 unnamed protein product [Spodoptera littoralis]
MCNLPPKFHSVCRLCLSFCGDNCSDVKLPIFDRDKDKSRLSEMIMANLSIMVSPEDLLPQVVCGGCAHKLDEFHTFRELSHKSERLLEQFLQYANSLSGPKEEVLNITAAKLEEIIKPLSDPDYEDDLKHKYAEIGSPDSTEEMKNLESRQAAVTLLQIKNYDPSKYVVKQEEEPHIMFNSVQSLPPSDRAREVMHCNSVIDIINKAVAVARETDESPKYAQNYTGVIDRTHAAGAAEYQHEYPDEQYAYTAPQHAASPTSNDDHDNKEMDLSLYSSVKNEPNDPTDQQDREHSSTYFHGALAHKTNFVDEYKQHIYGRNKMKTSKENSSVYEDCSRSSSGSDPDRLQMDISQMSQDDPEETQSARSTQSSPQPAMEHEQDKESLWQALHRQNGRSGEATQLLRRLINSKQLGMTVSPLRTPASPLSSTVQQPINGSVSPNGEWTSSGRGSSVAGTARRKQSFPARAQPIMAVDPPATNAQWPQTASENQEPPEGSSTPEEQDQVGRGRAWSYRAVTAARTPPQSGAATRAGRWSATPAACTSSCTACRAPPPCAATPYTRAAAGRGTTASILRVNLAVAAAAWAARRARRARARAAAARAPRRPCCRRCAASCSRIYWPRCTRAPRGPRTTTNRSV